MAQSITARGSPLLPLHGILAAFPIALFTGALISDIAYANSATVQWANFSVWMIAGGVVGAVLAGIAGIVDAVVWRGHARRRSMFHSVLTIVMLVVAIVNGFVHSRDGWTSVVPTGLILSAITAVLVLVTGWIGYTIPDREVRA